jgi:GT2 family glycosyltransferase/lipopolysaccharide/colanic/teichoic acid biosynthesis glycosyltransferase
LNASPRVSLVIVHFRTPSMLGRCLERIERAGIAVPYEVVVEDNAPLDGAAEELCRGVPGVVYRRNDRNLGFGRAVNQGIRAARGEFFLVLNPDVEVEPGSVEELLREMERDPAAGIVAPKLLYADGSLQDSCRTFYTLPVFLLRRTFIGRLFPNHRALREHLMLDYDHATTRAVDWCLGASLLVRRRAVEDVGPMDERFFLYFEDVDWCYRMAARGWKVVYHPAATMVHHYQRASAGRPSRGLLIHLASSLRYYEKWSFLLYWLKRRSGAIRRAALIVSDLVAVNVAFVTAYLVRDLSSSVLTKPTFGFGRYARFLAFTDAVALLALALAGMYRSRRREEAGEQLIGATRAVAATGLLMMASTFLFSSPVYSRAVVGLFLPLSLVLILLLRWGIFRAQGSMRAQGLHLRRVGILAPPADAAELDDRLRRHGELGLEILPLTSQAAVLERPRGGQPHAVGEAVGLWVQDERIAEVVLFEDWPGGDAPEVLAQLLDQGIPTRWVPCTRQQLQHGARMGDFLGYPALQIAGGSTAVRSWEKRLLDASAALILWLLLLLPYAAARIVLASSGRGLVASEVVGRRGRRLRLSALPGSWPRGALFTLLREFPTLRLWFRGEWSLVGIAPLDPARWDACSQAYRRSPPDAPPGWIHLAGDLEERTTDEICARNSEYVSRWSLALDMNLILERFRRRKEPR